MLPGQTTTVETIRLQALPGTLQVNWFFANGRLCGSNGVADIDIALFQNDEIQYDLQTPCDDGVEEMTGITSGTYDLSVLGADENGIAQFGGSVVVDIGKGDYVSVDVEQLDLNE